jgi:uncharacterized protein (DUF433 family)
VQALCTVGIRLADREVKLRCTPFGVNLALERSSMASANGVIVRDPGVLGGTPVFRGTRVPFQNLLDYLEGGQTLDQFLEDFPTV